MYKAASLPSPDFRALFEAGPGLCLLLRPEAAEFTIVAVSDAFLRATMTERDAILGHSLFDIFPDNPEDPDATGVSNLRASLTRVYQQRVPHTMDVQKYDIRRPESVGGGYEERYWSSINSPVGGYEGEISFIHHHVEDVTAVVHSVNLSKEANILTNDLQVHAEECARIEQSNLTAEVQYRMLVESAPNLVWARKANGDTIYVNQRWTEYTGLTLEDSGQVPPDLLHHPDDYAGLPERWREANASGAPYEAEFRFRRFDGAYRWFLARGVPIKDEEGHIVHWIGTYTDIHEQKMAAETLRKSEERTRLIVETALDAIITMDAEGIVTGWNPQAETIFGYLRAEALGCTLAEIIIPPSYREAHRVDLQRFLATDEIPALNKRIEITAMHSSGREFPVELSVSPAKWGDGFTFSIFVRDLTERKRLEEQLLQAQKLESVGRLAGGVAHDFNNLLTVILGYSELTVDTCDLDANGNAYLSNVMQAAEKAANLTSQLLAFARQQIIEPKVVNLNDLISGIESILRRLITENIELVTRPEERLHAVKVDPGQFEQILVNLVVNARDVMPEGGRITIETQNTVLDKEFTLHHAGVAMGDYVLLTVSDTGSGMEEAVRLHVFEPFFTTKERGRGTGLGLATVYGIVKQAGGHIWLYSEPGEGTTFKIYLPRTDEAAASVKAHVPPHELRNGSETILLVEDEAAVRTLGVQALRIRGYTVLEAMNGEDALRLVKGREQEIALLITDVIMPQMSGKELADRLRAIHPDLKTLYASGYTENTIVHRGVLELDVEFLSKPFTPSALANKVRDILDNPQRRQ